MVLKAYTICKGRKVKREKLTKPISCKKFSNIQNYNLNEKDKMRFITQLFRWFKKDSRHYKLSYFLKNNNYISNCDSLNLVVKIQKAGWKKLLLKLNYKLKDYDLLKRRSYSLVFIFFFNNVKDNKTKEITIDIQSDKYDKFQIFITTNGLFLKEFYNIINVLNKQNCEDY